MILNYYENEKKLLYYDHGVDEIPEEIIAEFSVKDIKQIDFSSNSLVSLNCISHFSTLKEVIFDNNLLCDASVFPQKKFPDIILLSLNHNKFGDLDCLLKNLVGCFPNVRYLSLLGNPLCPELVRDFNEEDSRAYRLSIISRMPKLRFLDDKQVDKHELLSIMQLRISTAHKSRPTQIVSEYSETRMEKLGALKKFFGLVSNEQVLNPSPNTSSDPRDTYNLFPSQDIVVAQIPSKTVFYGKAKSLYDGSQSQGNRFILNQDL